MLPHPLHPVFVHFTIGLTSIAIISYYLGMILPNQRWKADLSICSTWMFLFSAIITLVTLTTGYLQYISVAHDSESHLAMVSHRYWAIATSILLFAITIWSIIRYKKGVSSGILYPIALLGLISVLVTTAYKGGDLVYNFGLGVKSTPEHRKLLKKENGNHHESIFNIEDSEGSDGHNHEH